MDAEVICEEPRSDAPRNRRHPALGPFRSGHHQSDRSGELIQSDGSDLTSWIGQQLWSGPPPSSRTSKPNRTRPPPFDDFGRGTVRAAGVLPVPIVGIATVDARRLPRMAALGREVVRAGRFAERREVRAERGTQAAAVELVWQRGDSWCGWVPPHLDTIFTAGGWPHSDI